MKRCPSCQQTYPDDAPDYCSNDGMRLVDEEAASFDPEKTVMASGLRGSESASPPSPPQPPPQPPSAPQPFQAQEATPGIKPPTEWPPQAEQQSPQPWNAPGGAPSAQPGGWPTPQPAQNWGGAAPYQQPAANMPYSAPYAPVHVGRSRALSIAALVTGVCAVTIMSVFVLNDRRAALTLMLILAILGMGLGVVALIFALQKPTRFGGVPLAIAGLATGTAALVYYFTL